MPQWRVASVGRPYDTVAARDELRARLLPPRVCCLLGGMSDGAIVKITVPEKSSIQVGHAVWIRENCIVLRDDEDCDNCARHCPSSAITMVPLEPGNRRSRKIPTVNVERCIGCGACEICVPRVPSAQCMWKDTRIIERFNDAERWRRKKQYQDQDQGKQSYGPRRVPQAFGRRCGRDGSGIGRVRQERRIDVGDVGRGADRQDDLSRQQGEG